MRSRLLPVMLGLASFLVSPGGAARLSAQGTRDTLRIVVIEGEDAVNVVQQKTAVAPVVEVRDRNDQPVAGVVVRFAIRNGRATFNGSRALSVTTNAAGRAAATGLTPTGSGALQIGASAAFQGQTAAITIAQTNVMAAAQVAAATGAAGGGAGAGTGGAGGGAGLSQGAIVGIAGGVSGAAVAAATVISSGGDSLAVNQQPAGIGIRGITEFTFTVSGDAAPNATFTWDFGDGSTASGNSVTHLFNTEGTFQLSAEASGQSATATASVIVVTLTGTWRQTEVGGGSFQEVAINQTGTTLTGQWFHTCTGNPDGPGVTQCTVNSVSPLSGSVTAPNAITVSQDGECLNQMVNATMNSNGTQFAGTMVVRNPVCIPRPPANTTGMYPGFTFQRR